jgi:RHS repeat-associated protein
VVVAEQRYLPYGELRWSSGTLPTDFTFTGQRSEAFGLLDYNARYYDPLLGRFVSADTVVPDFSDPQALNRYSYTLNNPVRYRDPNGHWVESAIDIAFIAYDIYDISQNGWNWENGLSLTADVAGLILPGITGGGLAVRAVAHADDAVKILSHADEVVDAARVVDNIADAASAANHTADVAAQLARFENAGAEVVPDVLKAFGEKAGGYGDIAETAFGDRRITTLGRNVDTDVAAEFGERALKVPQSEWSLELNSGWLQKSIENGDIFYLGSSVTQDNLMKARTGEITVLTRELDMLLQSSYQRIGNYLVPPQLLR